MTKTRDVHLSSQGRQQTGGTPRRDDSKGPAGASDERAAEFGRLVRRASAGDEASMEELLVRAQEIAFRFSYMACGHAYDAEDVMQEALMATFRHVSRIKNPTGFRTWLYSTVRNGCLMKRRRRVDEPSHLTSIDEGADTIGDRAEAFQVRDPRRGPDDEAINRWLGRRLRQALKALPPAYRIVVFLREMEGLSTREVAQVIRISEANVKTRLLRARAMLREQLEA